MTVTPTKTAVFGAPPQDLAPVPKGAMQVSPLVPGASPLAAVPEGSLSEIVMFAPPGTLERRRALALALKALEPGGRLTALAPKDKGGARIAKELSEFGCTADESVKSHHRIATCLRPAVLTPDLDVALAEGAMRFLEDTGFWSQPGIFSWDRIDPGSAFLAEHVPKLSGQGADLGCGYGFLAREILASSPAVTSLTLVDIDGRAVEAARHNVTDPRAHFVWADLRRAEGTVLPKNLDFIVMNAPFHDGGNEDRSLLKFFLERAAGALKNGGTCWLVANRHLPYEAAMAPLFATITPIGDARGYKVFEAKVERSTERATKSKKAGHELEAKTKSDDRKPPKDVRKSKRPDDSTFVSDDGNFDLAAFIEAEGLDPKTMRSLTKAAKPQKNQKSTHKSAKSAATKPAKRR